MASVHFGRYEGAENFSRTVAIKRLHRQFANDPEFVAMFLDEARLASRVRHPNVVATLDVVHSEGEVFLVMEYVPGESLVRLVQASRKRGELVPPGHAVAIVAGMLHGLHAAHEATDERQEPLQIVHRDISPQNVLVGTDGVPRVLDFGIAKAAMRAVFTREGQMKGKLGYMSPEQIDGKPVDRRTDVFAAGVVLWEAVTGQRLFVGNDPGAVITKILTKEIPDARTVVENIPEALAAAIARALERDPEKRFGTALEFALELERTLPLPSGFVIGRWVSELAQEELTRRTALVDAIENPATRPLAIADQESQAPGREGLDEVRTATEMAIPGGRRDEVEPAPEGSTSVAASVSLDQSRPEPRRVRPAMVAVLLVLSALAGAAGYVLLQPPQVVSSHPGTTSSAFAASHAPAVPEKTSVDVVPSVTAAVSAAPLPETPQRVVTADAGTPAVAMPATSAAAPALHPTSLPPQKKPRKSGCNPPFTVLPDGIKRVKPQCI